MKHTYLFDFDGTLVDSMPYWSEKMLNVLNHYGAIYPQNIIEIITPLGDVGSANYFREVLGVQASVEEMIARMDEFALPKYRDVIGFKEGVCDYLKRLRDSGCSLNVLTASPHKMMDPCLKRLGAFDWFDNLWSCDDFGTTKSDPQIYAEAVTRIGTTLEDTVFFDDNVTAVQTAAEAGLFTVGVYDSSGKAFRDRLLDSADLYIDSFANAPAL